eukprot:3772348-Rhodomonas_salina.2
MFANGWGWGAQQEARVQWEREKTRLEEHARSRCEQQKGAEARRGAARGSASDTVSLAHSRSHATLGLGLGLGL